MEFVVSSDKKLLPYGMMNFADIRLDGYYYVDKTMYIPLIERSNRYFFFFRPRRFGKSLTLNMLQHYYTSLGESRLHYRRFEGKLPGCEYSRT